MLNIYDLEKKNCFNLFDSEYALFDNSGSHFKILQKRLGDTHYPWRSPLLEGKVSHYSMLLKSRRICGILKILDLNSG